MVAKRDTERLDKGKFVFNKIPKTGSTTMKMILIDWCAQKGLACFSHAYSKKHLEEREQVWVCLLSN